MSKTINNLEYTKWHKSFKEKSEKEKLTVGKDFCNHFGVSDAALYYMNNNKAYQHIWKHYLKI